MATEPLPRAEITKQHCRVTLVITAVLATRPVSQAGVGKEKNMHSSEETRPVSQAGVGKEKNMHSSEFFGPKL
jgi:hypothetical protein